MGLFNFFKKKSADNPSVEGEEFKAIIEQSISDFENRAIYSELTPEVLEKTKDDQLLQTIFDNVETIFEDGESYPIEKLKKLSQGKKAIFSIWILSAEINNGGFNQFYYNPSVEYAAMANDGLDLINAKKHSQILAEANATYLDNKEDIDKENDGTLESFSESYDDDLFEKFDEAYYKLESETNLEQLQIKFIRENYQEFIG